MSDDHMEKGTEDRKREDPLLECVNITNKKSDQIYTNIVKFTFTWRGPPHPECKVSSSVQWHHLEAVVSLQVLPCGVQVQLAAILAPPQLVPPGAMGGGVGGRRGAGRRRCGQGRFGDVDLWGAVCGGRRCGSWWDSGGPLDGRSVVPPQDSHARGLLLVLFRLLLTLHLLLQDQLNVLLQAPTAGRWFRDMRLLERRRWFTWWKWWRNVCVHPVQTNWGPEVNWPSGTPGTIPVGDASRQPGLAGLQPLNTTFFSWEITELSLAV